MVAEKRKAPAEPRDDEVLAWMERTEQMLKEVIDGQKAFFAQHNFRYPPGSPNS